MKSEKEIAMAKMRKGICAVCDRPIKKHTKNARKVCFGECQTRYGIGIKKIMLPDGRMATVNIAPASLRRK